MLRCLLEAGNDWQLHVFYSVLTCNNRTVIAQATCGFERTYPPEPPHLRTPLPVELFSLLPKVIRLIEEKIPVLHDDVPPGTPHFLSNVLNVGGLV
jgi:hypothetical protein